METNLKPNEIIFLDFISGKSIKTTYSSYWEWQYGILPEKAIKKFKDLNLITLKLDIKRNITALTIPKLKQLLKSENLPLTRKKARFSGKSLGEY